ncbi:MAG: A24 family peptidase [Actinomycetia bacterium]|nr:A24 family peptidase [Actinomycetes bacterium]
MTPLQYTAQSILSAALFLCLLLLSYFDLTQRRLPNRLVAVVAGLGLVRCLVAGSLMQGVIGVFCATGIAVLVALIYRAVRGQMGMGAGDLKLLGALGLFFGPPAFWILPLASCASVAVLPVVALWRRRYATRSLAPCRIGADRTIAFGPFIAIGATILLMAAPMLNR